MNRFIAAVRRSGILLALLWGCLLSGFTLAAAQGTSFLGDYANGSGSKLSLKEGNKPGTIAGVLQHAGQTRVVVADIKGSSLEGIASGTTDIPDFRAALTGDALKVQLGDERFTLKRAAAVAAPPETRSEPKPSGAILDLGPVKKDPKRRWTVAIYLAGDNDLELAAMLDRVEINAALPAEGVEVILLLDRAKGYLEEEGGWTDADVFHYDPELREIAPLKGLGEINTGDGRTLAGFLAGVFRTYPAERHAAIIWDHGGGWQGIGIDEEPTGSNKERDILDLGEIRAGLQAAVDQTKRPLDILAFDACLMAQLEVALQMKGLADHLIASEEAVPTNGFPYQTVIPLFANPKLAPRQIAAGLVKAFNHSYEELHKPATTLSALDLSKAGEVATALEEFTATAEAGLADHWPAAARALFYAESYQPRAERLTDGQTPSFDLLDLARRIAEGYQLPAVSQAYTKLEAAVGRLVIASATGDLRRLSHGLSIYGLRTPAQWSDDYGGTPLAKSRWPSFLRRVHELAAKNAGEPIRFSDVKLVTQGGRKAVQPFNGDRIEFAVTGRSIVQMLQLDALRNDQDNGWLVLRRTWVPDPVWMARAAKGAADLTDLFMPVFNDGRTDLSVELTGLQFVITNGGEEAARATLDTTGLAMDAPVVAQAHWYPAGTKKRIPVEVHFDRTWWRVAAIYERPSSPQIAPREVQPAKEDQFAFLLESVGDDGKEGLVEAPKLTWLDGLSLVLTADTPDQYQTALIALTMDGRTAATGVTYTVEENPGLTEWTESWKGWKPARMQGTWSRQLLTGPNVWQELDSSSEVTGPLPMGPGVFQVKTEFGPKGARETIPQLWVIETRGLPNLRIVQPVEGGADLTWYGPARLGSENDQPWMAMKAVQVGGVIWRWKQSLFDALKLDVPARKGK